MQIAEGGIPSFAYRDLTIETNCRSFRCGEPDIDKWFWKKALKNQTNGTIITRCAHLEGNQTPIGLYALACVTENVRHLPNHNYHGFGDGTYFPCLQLVYLAVQKELQGKEVGTSILGAVVSEFAETAKRIGLPHLILVPINERVKTLYARFGFEEYFSGKRMYLPAQQALGVIAQISAKPD